MSNFAVTEKVGHHRDHRVLMHNVRLQHLWHTCRWVELQRTILWIDEAVRIDGSSVSSIMAGPMSQHADATALHQSSRKSWSLGHA
mmetsp:Transcript_53795/g.136538  ORF Transcript_53795/g.136538 Transcript_53795/m.136538 type:complete len:86 (+) Transcript_53795:1208-1465(+)